MKVRTKQLLLSGLLLLQLGGLAFSLRQDDGLDTFVEQDSFLTFTPENVSSVQISTADETLQLSKQDGQWVLPELQGFPVSTKKLHKLLNTLHELQRSYPIAQTKQAQKQLQVSEKHYERKLTLGDGEQTTSVYFGSTPGFKKVYARRADELETYTVPMILAEVSVQSAAWMNREVLFVDREAIADVTLPGVHFTRGDKGFTVASMNAGEDIDAQAVDRVLAQVAKMTFIRLVKDEEFSDAEEGLRFQVNKKDGSSRTYRFFVASDKESDEAVDHIILSVSDLPFRFLVGKGPYTILKEARREQFLKEKLARTTEGDAPKGAEAEGALASTPGSASGPLDGASQQ